MRALLLSLIWTGLFACSPQVTQPGDAKTERVVILCSRDEKFMHGLWETFKSEHPNVDLVVDYGKDAGYLDRLRVSQEHPVADLYISKASGPLESAAKAGLLATLPDNITTHVPERVRGANNQWTGLSARARVLVRRKGLTDPPSTLSDLTDPKHLGRVARTVATNASFVGGVSAYLADHGEEATRLWLTGLQQNTAGNVHPKHTPAVAAVAEGLADVALVNHYYFYRAVLGKKADNTLTAEAAEQALADAPIEIVYPEEGGAGVAWNVSGAGLVKNGPNPSGAKAVLQFLLSERGQQQYAFTNREYPVVEGLPSPPGVHPATAFTWSATPLSRLAEKQGDAVGLIQEMGLE